MSARGVDDGQASGPPWRWSPWARTAKGRPPSPLIGAGYVLAVQWVAFVSTLLQQWACG